MSIIFSNFLVILLSLMLSLIPSRHINNNYIVQYIENL